MLGSGWTSSQLDCRIVKPETSKHPGQNCYVCHFSSHLERRSSCWGAGYWIRGGTCEQSRRRYGFGFTHLETNLYIRTLSIPNLDLVPTIRYLLICRLNCFSELMKDLGKVRGALGPLAQIRRLVSCHEFWLYVSVFICRCFAFS